MRLLLAIDLVNNRAEARETLRVLFKKRGRLSSEMARVHSGQLPTANRPASTVLSGGAGTASCRRQATGDLTSARRTPGAASRATHGLSRRAGCAAPGSRARLLTPGPRKAPVRGLRSRLARAPPARPSAAHRSTCQAAPPGPGSPRSSAPPPAPPAVPVRAPGPPVTWAVRVT